MAKLRSVSKRHCKATPQKQWTPVKKAKKSRAIRKPTPKPKPVKKTAKKKAKKGGLEVFIGSDHAGFALKQKVISHLREKGTSVSDMGPATGAKSVDYPDFAGKVARHVQRDDKAKGIVICGSGIGISIAANKHKGIRCGLAHDHYTARMTREHNDANVLALGARVIGEEVALDCVDTFMKTRYLNAGNHPKRVAKLDKL